MTALRALFESHACYISKNPVVAQLLTYLSQSKAPRLRRQVQGIIWGYESNLSLLISLAQKQDLIRTDIEAHSAARLFITLIHGLILRTLITGESVSMTDNASELFSMYVTGIQAHA